MADSPESKKAALDQLRSWRAVSDRRDALIYAARLAGASYAEIHDASGVAVNTVRSAVAAQEAAVQSTATDPLAQYHHPHFLSVDRQSETRSVWAFKQFTGTEPRPEIPESAYGGNVPHDQFTVLINEYDAAVKLWATAKFRQTLPPLVAKLGPVWSAYQQAREAMDEAYKALLTTGDSTWRAQVLKLTGLHADARAAADAWDKAENELLRHDHAFRVEARYEDDDWQAPKLEDLISELGVDAKAWKLNQLEDHSPEPYSRKNFLAPAAFDTAEVIDQQKARIREVGELTGDQAAGK